MTTAGLDDLTNLDIVNIFVSSGETMRTQIIRIGNSRGIRIPKLLLEKCRLEEEVELEVRAGQLVIRPIRGPRKEWTTAFRQMAEYNQDDLLDEGEPMTKWSSKNWEW